MRPTGYWRPEGYWEPLIGSYLRSADETLLLDATLVGDTSLRAFYAGVRASVEYMGKAQRKIDAKHSLRGGSVSEDAPIHPFTGSSPPHNRGWGPNLTWKGFFEFLIYLFIFLVALEVRSQLTEHLQTTTPPPQPDPNALPPPGDYNWTNFSSADLFESKIYNGVKKRTIGNDGISVFIRVGGLASALGAILAL